LEKKEKEEEDEALDVSPIVTWIKKDLLIILICLVVIGLCLVIHSRLDEVIEQCNEDCREQLKDCIYNPSLKNYEGVKLNASEDKCKDSKEPGQSLC
jgi:hypothetical protein